MSELIQWDRHNYNNPRCPYCNSISAKNGIKKRQRGKFQRYLCVECGKTFQREIK